MELKKQNFTYNGVKAEFTAQSLVECRFPGEIATVLAANATLSPLAADVTDGEVFYKGKLLLTLVYEDSERNVCRSERGMEFSHTVKNEACTPACKAALSLQAVEVKERREGSGLYLSVVVEAKISLSDERTIEYVADAADVPVQRRECKAVLSYAFSGEAEADDEFDTEYLGDILLHSERVSVTDVTAEDGVVSVTGEINLNVCALKEESKLVSLERLIPFRAEIPCEGAKISDKCVSSACVIHARVQAEPDEERGKCRVRTDFTLSLQGRVYEDCPLTLLDDAFSPKRELTLQKSQCVEECVSDTIRFSERVSGRAALSGSIDFSDSLSCVLLSHATASAQKGEDGERIDGVLSATLILRGNEGAHKSRRVELPFSLPLKFAAAGRRSVSVMACGVSVRQRKEGEAEVEGTLRFAVTAMEDRPLLWVEDIVEGEPYPENENAVSIYMPQAGASLWETAKQLKKSPEEVERSNPELKFPLTGEERILIYRQAKE